jgi:ABC-type multidrug transport system ATPase subunit
MQIELKNLGKRFNRQWIFRNLNFTFNPGNAYAITGHNGSGKSTLLQIIAGSLEKTEGELQFRSNGNLLQQENHYSFISLSAPYLELIEEFTLLEFFEFHFSLKPLLPGYSIQQVIERIELTDSKNKQIRNFSSGMKQRAKLGQAFFSDVPVVLLDEPTANFDTRGIDLYLNLAKTLHNNRIMIICSNDEHEIGFCTSRIDITKYKKN